mmetsp:Transcript_36623/g.117591  ORF Transcript_36623/g.117591 Transcript_36623/m.117591 type:complete len:226 (+) Transcript_36623:3557-4234(+)
MGGGGGGGVGGERGAAGHRLVRRRLGRGRRHVRLLDAGRGVLSGRGGLPDGRGCHSARRPADGPRHAVEPGDRPGPGGGRFRHGARPLLLRGNRALAFRPGHQAGHMGVQGACRARHSPRVQRLFPPSRAQPGPERHSQVQGVRRAADGPGDGRFSGGAFGHPGRASRGGKSATAAAARRAAHPRARPRRVPGGPGPVHAALSTAGPAGDKEGNWGGLNRRAPGM